MGAVTTASISPAMAQHTAFLMYSAMAVPVSLSGFPYIVLSGSSDDTGTMGIVPDEKTAFFMDSLDSTSNEVLSSLSSRFRNCLITENHGTAYIKYAFGGKGFNDYFRANPCRISHCYADIGRGFELIPISYPVLGNKNYFL